MWRRSISLMLVLLLTGCSVEEIPPVRPAALPAKIELLPTRYLPNAVRIHERVISGGLPEGDAAFEELKQLGIKTLISVDGVKPDVAQAKKFGMRYVHLPHGYDGVPDSRAKELAKAVRDLPGPIYIHCHHGHHRSPAAAAVACIGAGLIGYQQGAMVLQVAGTSEHYRGLFQSADSARPFDLALLDELECEFPPIARLPAMAEAMVAIEQAHAHLKAIEAADWHTPLDQPALAPEHEALLLREHLTELLRSKEVRSRPARFQEFLSEAEELAQTLEANLRMNPQDKASASATLQQVANNCLSCHRQFRDVPKHERR